MEGNERSSFVRTVGDIVLDSFRPASSLTGIILSIPLIFAALAPAKTHGHMVPGICIFTSILLTMYAQARLAMNGFAGDSRGGFFSPSGGRIEDVIPVFGRLLALSIGWALPIPVMIWIWEPKLHSIVRFPFPTADPPPTLLVVYIGTILIAPFFLLPVAVAATRFTEIFSGGLWRGLFGGRLGEVVLMIVATVGAPLALATILAPWLASLSANAPGVASFLGAVVGIYLVGVTLSVHAKLSGFFAAAIMQGEVEEAVPLDAVASASGVPSAPPASRAVDNDIRQAWAAFPSDHEAALARLGALAAAPVPDAKTFHALSLMKHKAGDAAGALEAARQAIPLCLLANEGSLAAELYRNHAVDATSLLLDHAQLVAIGDVLFGHDDPSAAANAWAHALNADATDRKAFKGLLKVADQLLHTGGSLDNAIRIYEFLLQRVPDSPFADHAKAQLDIASRKASKG